MRCLVSIRTSLLSSAYACLTLAAIVALAVPAMAQVAGATAGTGTKDPLAYQTIDLPGGTIAKFENWQYTNVMGGANIIYCDAFPKERMKDFILRTCISTPSAQDLANLFTAGP